MPNRCYYIIIFFAFAILLTHGSRAYGVVTGQIELDYGHFEADEGGSQVADAEHFAQKYTLVYRKSGVLLEGRGGSYDLMLGGEWIDLDSDIVQNGIQTDVEIDTAKVLYRGNFLFAPGGLPLRFNVYSRDSQSARFEDDSIFFSEGLFEKDTIEPVASSILSPQIFDDVTDGRRIETGASLILGIKNGSYLGRYRNLLSHFPKLLVDYREIDVKDTKSLTPSHFKDREMAFVSLNKKHNWIHYRFHDHRDYINPTQDSEQTTYLIGTVNQYMQREWINLTNWIQLSTDGSYVEDFSPRIAIGDEDRYSLNLFSKTSRFNWQSTMFSNYERIAKVDSLRRTLDVPVFANGTLNRNTSWRFRFVGSRENEKLPFAIVNQESKTDSVYSTAQFTLNKTSEFLLQPSLEVESVSGNRDKGDAVRGRMSLLSNRNNSPGYDLDASTSFGYWDGVPDPVSGFPPVDYWEVEGNLALAKNLTPRLRTGGTLDIVHGSGDIQNSFSDYIEPRHLSEINATNTTSIVQVTDSLTSIDLSFFVEHVSLNRVSNTVEFGLHSLETDIETDDYYYILHRIEHNNRATRVSSESKLLSGDSILDGITSTAGQISIANAEYKGFSFSNLTEYQYSPNRKWKLTFLSEYDLRDTDDTVSGGSRLRLGESFRYTWFLKSSRLRRLADLSEKLEYEYYDLDTGEQFKVGLLTVVGNYYPTVWSRLGARIRVQNNFEAGFYETGYGLYADLNFSKLDVGLEYELGMRTDDDFGTVMDRDEQRWQVNVKKIF